MPGRTPQQSGVSLIEALVALVVMGFGILGVLGMQASLRMNGDIAKQRSEAVRIAQETVETARGYADMDAFRDDIVPAGPTAVAGYAVANASYWVQTQVVAPADEHAPRQKGVVVTVGWTDRTGQPQTLRLVSNVHGVPPALPGSLALPGDTGPVRTPGRRHFAIPPDAVIQEGGQEGGRTSIFTPPGADTVRWVFDNSTGIITSICMPADSCTVANAFLLAGHVRFATDVTGQPLPSHAESPTGPVLAIEVEVDQTAPAAATVACYEQTVVGARRYFCAVPVGATLKWSGRSRIAAGLLLAVNASDNDAAAYRVCRYTPARGCHPAVGSLIWGMPDATANCTEPSPQTNPPTPSRKMLNADHPLNYDQVAGALTNQNFLVIRAGNGTDAFECPGDDTGTPYLNGNTWRHQPHE